MRVVSIGNKGWNLLVCTSCKSQLEITEEDIFRENIYDDREYSETYYMVECVCGSQIMLHNLPEEVKAQAIDKRILDMKPQKISLRNIPDFPKKGILFKDISPLLANPKELKQLTKYLAGFWEGKIDKIGGFDARGFIFGSMLAYEMDLPFFMLRKKGKLPGNCEEISYNLEYGSASLEIQDDAVKKDDRVLLIDDLLATGGTALAGCKLVEKVGGDVAGLQFIIELESLQGRQKLSLYKVDSIIRS